MLEDAQCKLARTNLLMSDDQFLAIASTAVLASKHFPHPTNKWEGLPRNNKTWTAWKAHYRAAHLAWKQQLLASGKLLGSGGVAHAVRADDSTIALDAFTCLDGYPDNLVVAASTERTTLVHLIKNNPTLTANVTSLTASIASLTAAYTMLATSSPHAPSVPTPTQTNQCPHGGAQRGGYCWTHGYHIRVGHDSRTCNDKATGHKDEATRPNTMNGCTDNKGWDA
jgi:hypothetical protein